MFIMLIRFSFYSISQKNGQRKNIPTTYGSKAIKAMRICPRRVVFRLSQLNKYTARPKVRKPPRNKIIIEPQGEKSAALPIARPLKAFMACVEGKSRANFPATPGNILFGIIRPPINMEGRKTSCDHSTVTLELGEITPIRTLIPDEAKAIPKKINIK